MKTKLPESISNVTEARAYLFNLYLNGEDYHPDDDANDAFIGIPITKEEGDKMNALMEQVMDVWKRDGKRDGFEPYEHTLVMHNTAWLEKFDLPKGLSHTDAAMADILQVADCSDEIIFDSKSFLGRIMDAHLKHTGFYTYVDPNTKKKVCILKRPEGFSYEYAE